MNIQDKDGHTVLFFACMKNDLELVKCLIDSAFGAHTEGLRRPPKASEGACGALTELKDIKDQTAKDFSSDDEIRALLTP